MKAKNIILAVFSGVLLASSFPGVLNLSLDGWPGLISWIALIPLFFAVKEKKWVTSFFLGVICGFTFFSLALYWITYIEELGSMAYPCWIAFSLYLSLFIGLFCLILRFNSLVFAPFIWVCVEYLRGIAFTGFPWILLGYSQFRNMNLIQISSVTGVYGVSFLVVLANMGIAFFFFNILKGKKAFFGIVIFILFFLMCYIYGFMEVANFSVREEYERMTKTPWVSDKKFIVSVLQGNISQDIKWSKDNVENTFKIYEDLARKTEQDNTRLIIWPESASTVYLKYDKKYFDLVKDLASGVKSDMLVGTPDAITDEKGNVKEYFNSAFLISKEGKFVSKYDKVHLVPFGEYVPLKKYLASFEKYTIGFSDYTKGKSFNVFKGSKGDKFGVAICWEIIFPDICRNLANNGAEFLVTISNDAWYRKSAAPYQHFMVLPFRAVENRVNIVRAANTGVSGFVDFKGEIVSYIDIFKQGKLSSLILIRKKPTLYAKWGDWFVILCLVFSGIGLFLHIKDR